MIETLISRLDRAFKLTFDLYASLNEPTLQSKLKNLPSNTLGEQVWCIIGARESYFNAIENKSWIGFSCSLKDASSKQGVEDKLQSSYDQIQTLKQKTLTDPKELKFLFDLLEHEIQHHGQLIRYIYGNKLVFPDSWKKRYSL